MPLSLSFVRIPTHVYRRNSNLNPSPYPINGWLSLLVLVDVLHPVKGISMSELSSSKNPDSFSQGGSKNSLVKIRSRDQASWFDWFELSKRIYKRRTRKLRSGCYITRATKATWKVYVHMYARSSNCQLNDAKHMDYFVATTLFRDAPRFVFDDSKRSRASELSKSRPDLLGTGKIIIHPELWQKFLAGWEKCQCLFDPYNLSYRSLELDRFSYISLFARKCILPKGDIDLPSPLEEIRDLEKKISFNTLVLCLLLKASSRGLLVDKFSRVIDPEVT